MKVKDCPYCHNSLHVKKLACHHCNISLEGDFYTSPLMGLSEDQLSFVELFVLSSGSLKEMAQILGVTYPTVRGRLDQVIKRLKQEMKERDGFKVELLMKVEEGKITPEKAAQIIENL